MPPAKKDELQRLAQDAGHDSWGSWVAAVAEQRGRDVCGAKTKSRPERPCEQSPVKGGKRCRVHGGTSLSGPEHPGWKTGEHSKYGPLLSGRLAEHYEHLEATIRDAFDLTAEARLADARMAELAESLHGGGHVSGRDLRGVRDGLRAAIADGDVEGLRAAVESLDALATRATHGDNTWREWTRLSDLKRRLADTHARQRAREHGPVQWPDLTYVVHRMRAIIAAFVPRARLGEFKLEMDKLGTIPGIEAEAGAFERDPDKLH